MSTKYGLTIALDDGTEYELSDGIAYAETLDKSAGADGLFNHALIAEQFGLMVARSGFSVKRDDGILIYPAHRIQRIDIQKIVEK